MRRVFLFLTLVSACLLYTSRQRLNWQFLDIEALSLTAYKPTREKTVREDRKPIGPRRYNQPGIHSGIKETPFVVEPVIDPARWRRVDAITNAANFRHVRGG